MTVVHPWQFKRVPRDYWVGSEGRSRAQEATRWLLAELEPKDGSVEQKARNISALIFIRAGLEGMLRQVYANSPFAALIDVGVKLYPWQVAGSVPRGFWTDDQHTHARQAIGWLLHELRLDVADHDQVSKTLKKRHFIENGLGAMLYKLYSNSVSGALADYWQNPESVPDPSSLAAQVVVLDQVSETVLARPAPTIPSALVSYLKTTLRDKGWLVADLARATGGAVSQGYINNILGGTIATPGYSKLVPIANALQVPLTDLTKLAGIEIPPEELGRLTGPLTREVRTDANLQALLEIWPGLNVDDQRAVLEAARHLAQAPTRRQLKKDVAAPVPPPPAIGDALWRAIVSLLPKTDQVMGRKRLDDRCLLNGVLYILRTDIAWEELPKELGYGNGRSCLRRLREWQALGIWDHIKTLVQSDPDINATINWQRAE